MEENNKKYAEGLIPFVNIVHLILDAPPTIYNPPQFQKNIIINNLKIYEILRDINICPKCGDLMNIVAHKASTDNVIWRCHKRSNPHDITINISIGSVFEGFQTKINVLYFLLYFCFIENMSINESVIK